MMKKTYVKPAIETLKFASSEVILSGSPDNSSDDEDFSPFSGPGGHGKANACEHGSKAWFCK